MVRTSGILGEDKAAWADNDAVELLRIGFGQGFAFWQSWGVVAVSRIAWLKLSRVCHSGYFLCSCLRALVHSNAMSHPELLGEVLKGTAARHQCQ